MPFLILDIMENFPHPSGHPLEDYNIDQSEGSIAQSWPLIGQNCIFLKGVRPSVLAAESCDNTFSQQNPPMYQKMIE